MGSTAAANAGSDPGPSSSGSPERRRSKRGRTRASSSRGACSAAAAGASSSAAGSSSSSAGSPASTSSSRRRARRPSSAATVPSPSSVVLVLGGLLHLDRLDVGVLALHGAEHAHLLEGGHRGLDLDQGRYGVGVLLIAPFGGRGGGHPFGRHPLGCGRRVEDRQAGDPGGRDLGLHGVQVLGAHLVVVRTETASGPFGRGLGRRHGHPQLLGRLLNRLTDDLVGLQQTLATDPELFDLATQDLAATDEVLQDPAADGLGFGDHRPPPALRVLQLGGHVDPGLGQRRLQGGDGGPQLGLPLLGLAQAADGVGQQALHRLGVQAPEAVRELDVQEAVGIRGTRVAHPADRRGDSRSVA